MNTYVLVLITYMGCGASLGNNHRPPQPLIVQTWYERPEPQIQIQVYRSQTDFFLMSSKHSEILKKK